MTGPLKRPTALRAALFLLLFAVGGACYLLFVSLRDGPVLGCGTGSSCETVLKSRWAYLLPGIPVTAPALLVYLALLHGLLRPGRRSAAWRARMLVGALLVLGAGAWFIGLQAIVIGSYCKWCMTIHLAGMAGAACVLAALRPLPPRLLPKAAGAAVLGLAFMAACQIFFPQPTTISTKLERGTAQTRPGAISIGGIDLDLDKVPHRGNVDSGKYVLLLSDYTCYNCRVMHRYFRKAEGHFGEDSFLLVTLPVPLDPRCNPYYLRLLPEHRNACQYARIALALWFADRAAYRKFDQWIYLSGSPEEIPGPSEVRAKAEELIGKDRLAMALKDARVSQQLDDGVAVWKNLADASGTVSMPKLVIGDRLESGRFETLPLLYKYLEDTLHLKPVKGR